MIGVFPSPDSYLRLVSIYLLEYTEEWSVSNAYLSEKSLESLYEKAAQVVTEF